MRRKTEDLHQWRLKGTSKNCPFLAWKNLLAWAIPLQD